THAGYLDASIAAINTTKINRLDVVLSTRSAVTNASAQSACNSALTAKGATVAVLNRLDVAVSTRSVVTNASVQTSANAALTAKGATVVVMGRLDAAVSTRSAVTNASVGVAANTALTSKGLTIAKVGLLDVSVITRAPANTALSTATWNATRAGYLDAAISGINTTQIARLDVAVSSRSSHNAAAVNTTLSTAHGAGSWASATGFSVVTNASILAQAIAALNTALPASPATNSAYDYLEAVDASCHGVTNIVGSTATFKSRSNTAKVAVTYGLTNGVRSSVVIT
ncbi:MAG: hypothetical protein IMZ50_17320, partial [Candidatus Atribacteria bacterium]|nr:hypothetical protein [Candidatus Atribacteria bacterium]